MRLKGKFYKGVVNVVWFRALGGGQEQRAENECSRDENAIYLLVTRKEYIYIEEA